MNCEFWFTTFWWVFMCLKTADVASEDVWGIMLTWRGRSRVHVHTARALFFIILIILKAKLIFLIYLISTPRRASCKIYQNPRTKRAGFLGWVRLSHQHIIIKRRFQNPYFFLDVLTSVVALIAKRYKTRTIKYEALGSSLLAPQVIT